MITGMNMNVNDGLEGAVMLTSEQCAIPPANAIVGGTNATSTIPFTPVGSLLIAGMIGLTLLVADPFVHAVETPLGSIEISIVPTPLQTNVSILNPRETYERLRQQMASDGIPFLDAAELEREIADRKGTRSEIAS